MDALILACESTLRAAFNWTDRHCAAELEPQPPAAVGQFFASVVPGDVTQADDNPQCLDEQYSLTVSLMFRLAYAPKDRKAREALMQSDTGPIRLASRVGATLHGSYAVLNAANALIPDFAVETNGFVEPLRLRGIQYQMLGSEWAGGPPGDEDDDKPLYVATVSLGGARRVRVLGTVG